MTYCLLDEHPDSINAGGFANEMVEPGKYGSIRIIDFPASYHDGAAGITATFAQNPATGDVVAATISVGTGVAPGTYTIRVSATDIAR